MDLKVTRYEIEDRVATLTLHRPERLNSWTGRMHTEYRWILEEAFELGLLNALLEPEELMPYTYDYARGLADTVSPGSLRETKRQVYTDLHRDVGSAVRESDALLDRMTTEADYREAVSAFLEKRPPRWSNR
jgi:enoyl-CoA hydratase/carnithine racemase